MKPKKTSVLLLSVAGTLVFVLLLINLSQYIRNADALDRQRAPDSAAIKQLQERAGQGTGPGGESLARASALRPMSGGVAAAAKTEVPEVPSILLPTTQMYKPGFNANATTGHWYNDDSYQQVIAKKRAAGYSDGK